MNFIDHAKSEMKIAGLYDKDSDCEGMLPKAVEELLSTFAAQHHSGFSAYQTLRIFNALATFKTLSPLTNNPDEWTEVSTSLWQNRRNFSCFSEDGGKTYYDIDEKQSWFRRLLPRKSPLRWRLKHRKTESYKDE